MTAFKRIPLLELKAGQCTEIIAKQTCCGLDVLGETSFCDIHAAKNSSTYNDLKKRVGK